MPIRFLLDEMISPRVAEELGRRGHDTKAVDGSELDGADDGQILRAALRERRILVTYNLRDFRPMMADMLRAGGPTPGVIFVHGGTIPAADLSGLTRALADLAGQIERGEADPSSGLFLTRA